MSSEQMRSGTPHGPTVIMLLILAFCSIYSTWLPLRNAPAVDFYQFWVVGQEIKLGAPGDIYSDLERQRLGRKALGQASADDDPNRLETARYRHILETFSTPFLYTTFASWSSEDYAGDLVFYRGFSLLVVLASVGMLCHLLGYGLVATIVATTLFASWFEPPRSDWLVGNVNSIQLGVLTLFLWVSSRFPTTTGHVVGGVVLGLAAMWKPNFAIVIAALQIAWLIRGRHRKFLLESGGIVGGALVAFTWSSSAFGTPRIWQNWWSALSGLPDEIIRTELGNYAPARLIKDWLQLDLSLGIGLVCVVLTLLAMRRGLSPGGAVKPASNRAGLEDMHVAALAGLIALLASPLSWFHYFTSAIPMLLIVLGPISRHDPSARRWNFAAIGAVVALLAIMMRPLAMLEIGTVWARAVILCLGTALLFGLGLRALMELREHSTDESGAT